MLSGESKVRWGNCLEHEVDLEAGDFVFIPPYMPHQEINPSHVHPTQWVVVRSGPEAIAVELTKAPDGKYVEGSTRANESSAASRIGTQNAQQ